MNFVCATYRLHACFREPEALHLALLNQLFHRSRHIFDWHVRVNPVLIEKIDDVGLEALQRGLGDLLCSGRLSSSAKPRSASGSILNPNLVAITTWSRKGARASPTSSSFANGPYAAARISETIPFLSAAGLSHSSFPCSRARWPTLPNSQVCAFALFLLRGNFRNGRTSRFGQSH